MHFFILQMSRAKRFLTLAVENNNNPILDSLNVIATNDNKSSKFAVVDNTTNVPQNTLEYSYMFRTIDNLSSELTTQAESLIKLPSEENNKFNVVKSLIILWIIHHMIPLLWLVTQVSMTKLQKLLHLIHCS